VIEILSCWGEVHSVKASPSPDWGYKTYPPSILIVGDNPSSTLRLKQWLEDRGCQVYRTDIGSDSLVIAWREYFEIIVLILERPDEGGLEIHNKLKADPALAYIPLVVLTCNSRATEVANRSKMDNVYYLSSSEKGIHIGARLLQIIESVHYMIYRYMYM
jgi:CheY-like chemotaxis protein